MRKLFFLLLIIAVGGAVAYGLGYGRADASSPASRLKVGKVDRGEVVQGVAASGTVQPRVLVTVGTQVSGVVEQVMKDFNSTVKANETIAILDKRRLEGQVRQDEASLSRAKADVVRAKAQLFQAERELTRQRALAERNLISSSDLDTAVATEAVQRAAVVVAEAAVAQAEASLEMSRINLGYATIIAPVDGVVVSRAVEVGQTVAASLQTPTLFVIAGDLSKVRIDVSVPEADIGRIREGQRARFTVDAHAEKTFEGTVTQVRLQSVTVQNVVTYTVVLEAANAEGLLLPGMTANVVFEVAKSVADALRVPAAALRFQPTDDLLAEAPGAGASAAAGDGSVTGTAQAGAPGEGWPRGREGRGRGGSGEGARAGGEGRRPGGPGGAGRRANVGRVHVKGEDGKLRPVGVRVGVSDGTLTEVTPFREGSLPEGAEVATGILADPNAAPAAGASAATNPFQPQMPRGGMRGMR